MEFTSYFPSTNLEAITHVLQIQIIFLKVSFIYSWETEREREAETQAEGEAGSMQGAQRGAQSQGSRITPQAEGGAQLLSHPGCLLLTI